MGRRKTIDERYMGSEPIWDHPINDIERRTVMMGAFNWYNYFHNHKDAKSMLLSFLTKNGRTDDANIINKVSDSKYHTTIGWLANMIIKGFQPNDIDINTIESEIDRLKALAITSPNDTNEPKKEKPNVQEIMKEKAMEIGGELEGMYDDYYIQEAPSNHAFMPIHILKASTMLPQHVPLLIEAWEDKISELTLAYDGTDAYINESYDHIGKAKLRRLIKFCGLVIEDLHSYVVYKKSTRVTPKKKPISAEQLVSKLKYMKEFPDFNLKSIKPIKILGAKEMYVYDSKKRKLHYYVADPRSDGLGVKNNTIAGFSEAKSAGKTLRKPADQLKQIIQVNKANARKIFTGIETVDIKLTGRFNEHLIILRVH